MSCEGMRAAIRQFLLLSAVTCGIVANIGVGEERFPNELGSTIDEPQVILPESKSKVPIRPASQEVQASTDPLVKLAWETREATRRRLLSTSEHTPWQMMHGLLGLRQDFLILHQGETVNGLEWIKTGPMYQNEPWFQKTVHGGQAHPFNKPYWFEGHINQFLAILAMCNVPLDTQFGTPQGPITMRDMLKNAQMTVNEKEEVTWTLWALCTYLPSDAEWINARGERWSIERLVKVETAKPVGGPTSPCGGTHGLFALARARNVYLRSGKPLRGVWLQAEQKIRRYIETARMNQNSNGTLSSAFFKGRDYKDDFDKRMASTGHVLEFLMMALPQERLKEAWVRRAIEATANDLMANRKAFVSCSPLYHATNALSIYLDRVVPVQPNLALQNPPTRAVSQPKEVKTAEAGKIAPPAESAAASDAPKKSDPPKIIPGATAATPKMERTAQLAPDSPATGTASESAIPNTPGHSPSDTSPAKPPAVPESAPAKSGSLPGGTVTDGKPEASGDLPVVKPAIVPEQTPAPRSETPAAENQDATAAANAKANAALVPAGTATSLLSPATDPLVPVAVDSAPADMKLMPTQSPNSGETDSKPIVSESPTPPTITDQTPELANELTEPEMDIAGAARTIRSGTPTVPAIPSTPAPVSLEHPQAEDRRESPEPPMLQPVPLTLNVGEAESTHGFLQGLQSQTAETPVSRKEVVSHSNHAPTVVKRAVPGDFIPVPEPLKDTDEKRPGSAWKPTPHHRRKPVFIEGPPSV